MRLFIALSIFSFFLFGHVKAQESSCLDELYPEIKAEVANSEFNYTDSNAVLELWNAWRKVIFHRPDSAYIYAKEALRTSIGIEYKKGIGGSVLRMGNARQYGGEYPEAEEHIRCAITFELLYGSSKTQAIALSDLGNILYNRNKLDEALDYLEKSYEICQQHHLPRQEAQAAQNMARVFNAKGFHKLAIEKNLASLKIFESEGNKRMTSGAYNTLGITYIYAKDYEKAIQSFTKTANISKSLGDNEKRFHAEALINTGFCFAEMNRHDSSLTYYEASMKLAMESKDLYGILVSNGGRAAALTKLGQPEKAIEYLKQNLVAYDTLTTKYYELSTKVNLAEAYTAVGDLSSASLLLDEVNKLESPLQGAAHEQLLTANHNLFLAQNNISAALSSFKKLTALRDSLTEVNNISELQELELIYKLEKNESEIAVLNERRAKDQWKMSALGLGILATFLVGLLVFAYQRRRARLKRERDAQRLAKVLQEKQQLVGTVEEKERELTAQSVVTASRQEELQHLRNSLQELSKKDEVSSKEFNRLIRQVDQQLSQDHGWERVLETFKEVHPGFIEGLTHDFPDLTSSDLRLAALLRMNLDSKTIASLVHISPDSVKRARNRFRQKVEIESSVRLQDWITRRTI